MRILIVLFTVSIESRPGQGRRGLGRRGDGGCGQSPGAHQYRIRPDLCRTAAGRSTTERDEFPCPGGASGYREPDRAFRYARVLRRHAIPSRCSRAPDPGPAVRRCIRARGNTRPYAMKSMPTRLGSIWSRFFTPTANSIPCSASSKNRIWNKRFCAPCTGASASTATRKWRRARTRSCPRSPT